MPARSRKTQSASTETQEVSHTMPELRSVDSSLLNRVTKANAEVEQYKSFIQASYDEQDTKAFEVPTKLAQATQNRLRNAASQLGLGVAVRLIPDETNEDVTAVVFQAREKRQYATSAG